VDIGRHAILSGDPDEFESSAGASDVLVSAETCEALEDWTAADLLGDPAVGAKQLTNSKVDYLTAVGQCEAVGARLCTAEELNDGENNEGWKGTAGWVDGDCPKSHKAVKAPLRAG